MTDTSGEPPVHGITVGMVLGALSGVVLSWASFALVLLAVPTVAGGGVATFALGLALPAVVGLVLLRRPSTRRAGTGVLMGLAIGMITGAGVCAATLAALS